MTCTPITHPLLEQAGVRHGFFTRRGGVSTGLYESLNTGLGSADDPAAVAENRRRIAAAHGRRRPTIWRPATRSIPPRRAWRPGPGPGDRPEGDAVVTATRRA